MKIEPGMLKDCRLTAQPQQMSMQQEEEEKEEEGPRGTRRRC